MSTQQFSVISLLLAIATLSAVRVVDSFQLSNLHFPKAKVQKIGRGKTLLHAAPEGLKWFVKTEQFCKPYPQVKHHLEAHREWVSSLREKNSAQQVIASGYRVDENDKPGGGGLMIFAAKDYSAAEELVKNDPLIMNECVDWRLNRWIPEKGDITLD